MTWYYVLNLVVALAALVLGIYNAVKARRAPAEERQRQLWDDLRAVLQPLPGVIEQAQAELRYGRDVGPYPDELTYARRRLGELAPRFTERGMTPLLFLLSSQLRLPESTWLMSIHSQESVDNADHKLEQDRAKPMPGWGERFAKEREEAMRLRQAQHLELGRQLERVQVFVDRWIKFLDDRDAGRNPDARPLLGKGND